MWHRTTTAKCLCKLLPIFPDSQFQFFRECIDYRRTNAVQTTSGLIRALSKLAPGVRYGQDNSSRWEIFPLIQHWIKGHTTAFVSHCHPSLLINIDPDLFTIPRYRLIHSVIQCLPDKVDQPGSRCRTDIHSRTMSNGSNAFENLNIFG